MTGETIEEVQVTQESGSECRIARGVTGVTGGTMGLVLVGRTEVDRVKCLGIHHRSASNNLPNACSDA